MVSGKNRCGFHTAGGGDKMAPLGEGVWVGFPHWSVAWLIVTARLQWVIPFLPFPFIWDGFKCSQTVFPRYMEAVLCQNRRVEDGGRTGEMETSGASPTRYQRLYARCFCISCFILILTVNLWGTYFYSVMDKKTHIRSQLFSEELSFIHSFI